jgi:hypothetical protein
MGAGRYPKTPPLANRDSGATSLMDKGKKISPAA